MRMNATMQMMKLLEEEEAKEDAKKQIREKRWQNLEAQKKQSSLMEKKACEPHNVHAVLSTPSAAHAKCLKLQLGECADVAQVQAPSLLECNEVSNGWQKKCLNERS